MKTIVLIVGLGKFYGAGRRLYLQLCEIQPKIEPILIDAPRLTQIAGFNGINKEIFSPDSRGYGYWSWKPLLLHHYLKKLDGQGNIIYIDSGFDVCPPLFMDFIEFFNESPYKLLLSCAGHNVSRYTKPEVLKELNVRHIDTNNTMMLQTGFICLKSKSKIKKVFQDAFGFIKDGRLDLFNDEINKASKLPKYFVGHRHDQSVLNLLILNSPFIDEVGVLPTGLTPPEHRDWCPFPPVIANRNSTIVNLYWPLIKYSKSRFPQKLLIQIRILNKLGEICRYNYSFLKVIEKIISLQFIKSKNKHFRFHYEVNQILRPPVLIQKK